MQKLSADHLAESKKDNTEILTAEKTLEYIRRLEGDKANAIVNLQKRGQREMMNQQSVQLLMEVEKVKAFDRLFAEVGVGEEDIARAVKQHGRALRMLALHRLLLPPAALVAGHALRS